MENLPKFVVNRMRPAGSSSRTHPDADLLTAFAEQSLPERERATLMEHLILCGDCRNVLALALPEAETTAPHTRLGRSGARGFEGWFGWPAIRWGALAAGVILISAIGYQFSHRPSHPVLTSPSVANEATSPREGDSATAKQLDSKLDQPTLHQPKLDKPTFDQPNLDRPKLPQLSQEVTAFNDQSLPRPASRASGASARLRVRGNGLTDGNDSAAESNLGASTTTESATAESTVAMNRNPIALPGPGGMDVVKAKDPVTSQSASALESSSAPLALQTSPAMMLRASPRWSVTAAGILQRSFDGGTTWERVNPAAIAGSAQTSAQGFRVVAASGLEVWVGGSAGILYHTSDGGSHWALVAPSDGAVVLRADVLTIDFSDPRHGIISTANHELWSTADAGASWRKQQ
jgi:hypothetical protein